MVHIRPTKRKMSDGPFQTDEIKRKREREREREKERERERERI
jgi:hypothetical protein